MFSGHVANDSLYQGFINNGIKLDSINALGVKHFPKFKKLIIHKHEWSDMNGNHVSIRYINGKYSRIVSRMISMKVEAKKWLRKNHEKDITIFIYGLSSPHLAIVPEVRRMFPNAVISLIIPDLPEYKDMNASRTKRFLKRIESFPIDKGMKRIDYFFPFAEKMADYLKLPEGTWTLMEGSLNSDDILNYSKKKYKREKAIMYAGICNIDFGIDILLQAFSTISDSDVELWIAGTGNAITMINEYKEKDPRIKYFGYVSHDKVLDLEAHASAVINMRNPKQEVSQYAFPSKIFEYMLSGCPVLTFKVAGIPEEYYDYLYTIESVSPEGVSNAITKVLNMSTEDREAFGYKAKEFVKNNKNNTAQTKKMINFLRSKGVIFDNLV